MAKRSRSVNYCNLPIYIYIYSYLYIYIHIISSFFVGQIPPDEKNENLAWIGHEIPAWIEREEAKATSWWIFRGCKTLKFQNILERPWFHVDLLEGFCKFMSLKFTSSKCDSSQILVHHQFWLVVWNKFYCSIYLE